MKSKKGYTLEQLKELSSGNGNEFSFDFSRLPASDLEPVLTACIKFSRKQMKSLTFSLDLYHETLTKKPSKGKKKYQIQLEPTSLSSSAFKSNPKTVDIIIAAISQILPRTESLQTFTLRHIPLTIPQIERLGSLIQQNHTLTSIRLIGLPLGDTGFGVLSHCIRREGITELVFQACHFTDKSADNLKAMLSYQLSLLRGAEWQASLEIDGHADVHCLQRLDISRNAITNETLNTIADVLGDLPLTHLDITGPSMDSKLVAEIKKYAPKLDFKVTCAKTKDPVDDDVKIMLAPDIYVSGKRAEEFCECVRSLVAVARQLAGDDMPKALQDMLSMSDEKVGPQPRKGSRK